MESRAAWGTFSEWAASEKHRATYEAIRELHRLTLQLATASTQHQREKSSNDESARPPSDWTEPVYPESRGEFAFIQILDRSSGEALFSASNGLFVLRLSPGDSFQAYEGQNVRMTMHNAGETMSMTNGMTLPVFLSGASPYINRHAAGFQPDRSVERRLEADVIGLRRDVESILSADRAHMKGPFWSMVEVQLDSELRLRQVTIFDGRGPVYCLTERHHENECQTGTSFVVYIPSWDSTLPSTANFAVSPHRDNAPTDARVASAPRGTSTNSVVLSETEKREIGSPLRRHIENFIRQYMLETSNGLTTTGET